jgi:prepilin-type N-terminal cleavage/methylation domain-containing protein
MLCIKIKFVTIQTIFRNQNMKNQLLIKKQIQKGFTLVELLIVVIILAILAAIVVPQFATTTDDAKLASLDSTLSNVRAAIDTYYQQHGKYPGSVTAAGATCPGSGTAGTGIATGGAGTTAEDAFLSQLTYYTNSAGQACSTTDATFKFGPYMKKRPLPADPITGTVSTIEVTNTGNLVMTATGATTGGYKYDSSTGKFIVNLTAYQTR